jgi:predicted nucleotidyltransferase
LPEVTLEDELLAVHGVLENAGVQSALCGGIAANLYRTVVRATNDVDLCIVCTAPQLVSLTRLFEQHGWRAHPAWRKAELLRLERESHPTVALLIASTDYEREAITRAVPFQIGDRKIRVLMAEDLIVFKLVAGRHRDYEAVGDIVNAHAAELDTEFVRSTLAEFGMEDRWPRALEAAELEAEDFGEG